MNSKNLRVSLPVGVWTMLLLIPMQVSGELSVKVAEPKTTGGKTIIRLDTKNAFAEKVESARATMFLLDEQGKMAGQATKWFIGGSRDKPGLAPGATNSFYFVITTDRPLTSTNLTAKLSVNRVILENGKLANIVKDVIVTPAPK